MVSRTVAQLVHTSVWNINLQWPYCAQLCTYCNFNKYVKYVYCIYITSIYIVCFFVHVPLNLVFSYNLYTLELLTPFYQIELVSHLITCRDSVDHEKHYECFVKEFQSALNKSSITSFSSVYFGGGNLSIQSNVDTVLLVIVALLCIGVGVS